MNLLAEQNLDLLRDVRRSLIRVLALISLLFAAFAFCVETIMRNISGLIGTRLVLYSLPEAFITYLKVAFFLALLAVVPYVLFEIIRMASRRFGLNTGLIYPLIASGTVMFYAGAAFCYKFVLPSGIKYLLQFQTDAVKPMISLSSYVSFFFTFVFVFGLMFELPLLMFILGRFGIITVRFLNKQRRFFILLNSILSAMLTPTPDLYNMLLMMLPLQVLYEVGVVIVWSTGKEKLKKTIEGV